jgi:hypothetical protein
VLAVLGIASTSAGIDAAAYRGPFDKPFAGIVRSAQRSAQLCNAERGLKVGQDRPLGLLDQLTPSPMCGAD